MAKLLKLRRGTTSQHSSFTGAEGEVTVDTTKDTVVVHDGSTQGGFPLMRESGTATLATEVTVTANNSTNETVYPIFVDGATGSQGAETDTGLNYNPNTNVLVAGTFSGNLTGTPTLGTGVTVTAQGLEVAAGIVTAATFTGNITATTATITTANATKVVVGSAATVDQGNLDVSGITSIRSDCNVGVSTATGLVLTSANGTKYRLLVENDGSVSTTAV